ncbi:MAG: carbohydrate ABC transporter permease [Candidatus Bipolaricaulota bacterium]|nr:carbohydrate ABC transporter permease [Candidatus Bipolaricaulota bacterium]MDW8127285.1 carbohydrate ABC transporter permease [Candidatus Bipolaricaulota bacterium]
MRPLRLLLYLLLIGFAAYYLMPVYVLVATSLKSFAEVNLYRMWDPPRTFSLESFRRALFGGMGYQGLASNILNSVIMVIPATVISAALGSLNGYIFARWQFRGANTIFTLALFGMFIPYQSVLIPLVQTLRAIGLYGTIPGLILTHVIYGIPITTLIFRNYYATVPKELVEAARIDGAGLLGVYRRIMLPLSLPGFAVVLIWQFTSIWNDFLFAVTVAQNPAVQPATVALNNLAGSFIVEWNVQMAGALLAALPTLLVYVFLGRYFMRGLLAGSLKG